MTPAKCVGLLAALHKQTATVMAEEVLQWLQARNLQVVLGQRLAEVLERADLGRDDEALGREADLIVTFGGDGTLLAAARIAGPHAKPLLGVNLGGFGFLAAAPRNLVFDLLERALAGKADIEERLMLAARVLRQGAEVACLWGLNDAVVGKRSLSRLTRLETRLRGQQISDLPTDGIIISTPTGSTGYSLSAGGPVVDPRLRALLITPICPHTLSARPLVVDAKEKIEVILPVEPAADEIELSVDGQITVDLRAGDVVEVAEAPFSAKLFAFEEAEFYGRLRAKLGWGTPH